MNILAINTTDRKGGAAEVSWSIKTELEKLGHTVNIFVSLKRTEDSSVHKIPQNKWLGKLSHYLATDIDFWMSDKIIETEEFKKADIIHCHNLHGDYFKLSTLKKISELKPIIWTFHDMWPITSHCAHSFDGKIKDGVFMCPPDSYPKLLWNNEKYLSWRKKNIYENTKFNIVVPSLWLKNKVSQSILSEKPIYLIPNGIDVSIFKEHDIKEIRKKYGLPQDKKIIIFAAAGGKDNGWKGWQYVESVMSHFREHDDIIFVCIGGISEKKDDNKVVYIPYINDKNTLSEYFSCADIFLFTSIAENFPLVVLEAMGSGTPVVSFDVGGVKEAVTHKENGYIAKYKDTDDIIKGTEYIFSLPTDELQKMSKLSAEKVKNNYSTETMTGKYLELYNSVISEGEYTGYFKKSMTEAFEQVKNGEVSPSFNNAKEALEYLKRIAEK